MANTPNVRFKGFVDEWEECKLSEVANLTSSRRVHADDYVENGIPFYRGKEISELREHKQVSEVLYITKEKYGELSKLYGSPVKGDLLITAVGTIGNTWVVDQLPFYFKDGNLIWFKDIKCSPKYLDYVLSTPNGQKKIMDSAIGSNQKALTMVKLNELNFMFPESLEQEKIAIYFTNLDHLITLYQRKCDEVRQLKKFMLQKMFPKSGELIPEIRFVGFTDNWVQRKIKDIVPLQRGFDLPTSQMEDGIYPVVMSNGIGGKHSQYKVKGPGIVTGRSGTIGKLHYIEDDYWPHNTTLWVTDFNGNNQKFIYYMYQCLDLSRFSTGSGVPTLNRNDVHDEVVCIPSVGEQKKISEHLTNLDHLITLHQRKCDELKEVKRFMLQNMFPQKG